MAVIGQLAGVFAEAVLLGSMVFFAAGVAPTVFRVLEPEPAGRFLRAIFPVYYLVLILASGVAALAHFSERWPLAVHALVCVSTIWLRQGLTPAINRWRDAELAGDESAGVRFKQAHRISVLINLAQLAAVAAVIGAGALQAPRGAG